MSSRGRTGLASARQNVEFLRFGRGAAQRRPSLERVLALGDGPPKDAEFASDVRGDVPLGLDRIEASEVSDRFTLALGEFSAVLLGQTSCLFRADAVDKPVWRNGKRVEARLYIGILVSPKTLVDCEILLLEAGQRVSNRALPRSDGYRTQGEDRVPMAFHQNTTLILAFNSSFLAA